MMHLDEVTMPIVPVRRRPVLSVAGRVLLVAGLAAVAPRAAPLAAQTPTCAADSAFGALDFWLGAWDVFVQGRRVGEDEVVKVLDGCAVTEDWMDASRRRGHSLFFVEPVGRVWKQVWVTDRALGRGGFKEKTLIAHPPDGVRFQGEIVLEEGGSYLDRTTLTRVAADTVHQVIEVSTDGGRTWRATFDAQYVRRR
jgi:hypothetical protein